MRVPLRATCRALLIWIGICCQAAAQEPPAYSQETELGIGEFGERNFEEARAHFLKAHALYPNARTLRALGMAEFELRHYVDCVRYLEQALTSPVKPLDETRRDDTAVLLSKANHYVGRYRLVVAHDTRVTLDGSATDTATPLVLDIGSYTLELQAPGHVAQRRTLEVKGGENETLNIRLMALKDTSERTSDRSPTNKRPVYKNPWLWSAIGVVVLGGATAGILASVYGRQTESKTEAPIMGTGGAPPLMPPP